MFTNLLLVAGMLLLAQETPPIEDKSPPEFERVLVYQPPNTDTIKRNLRLFSSSEHETKEFLEAAKLLREYCEWEMKPKTKDTPPLVRRVRDALVQRGLDFEDRNARFDTIEKLDSLLQDRPLDQLPLILDALNDPYDQVRISAYGLLEQWIRDAKKRGKPPEKHLDEVVDLLIWKSLTEEDRADVLLNLIDPNRHRIRSLRRVIDSGLIRDPSALEYAKRTLEIWDPIYEAEMERERRGGPDPFGTALPASDLSAPSEPPKP